MSPNFREAPKKYANRNNHFRLIAIEMKIAKGNANKVAENNSEKFKFTFVSFKD
jgi:hypothetical protein